MTPRGRTVPASRSKRDSTSRPTGSPARERTSGAMVRPATGAHVTSDVREAADQPVATLESRPEAYHQVIDGGMRKHRIRLPRPARVQNQ